MSMLDYLCIYMRNTSVTISDSFIHCSYIPNGEVLYYDERYAHDDFQKRKEGKYQEWIQSSTTPDPGYHMGK